jgi:pimeloyl-ACP methyl ester carboxylesterase
MQQPAPANGGVRGGPMTSSEVRYVNSGGVHIAYRVFGDGPLDLVLVPAFTSHLEQNHEWPGLVSWNKRLASFSRLIVFDKRSTGLSDHAPGPVVLMSATLRRRGTGPRIARRRLGSSTIA